MDQGYNKFTFWTINHKERIIRNKFCLFVTLSIHVLTLDFSDLNRDPFSFALLFELCCSSCGHRLSWRQLYKSLALEEWPKISVKSSKLWSNKSCMFSSLFMRAKMFFVVMPGSLDKKSMMVGLYFSVLNSSAASTVTPAAFAGSGSSRPFFSSSKSSPVAWGLKEKYQCFHTGNSFKAIPFW